MSRRQVGTSSGGNAIDSPLEKDPIVKFADIADSTGHQSKAKYRKNETGKTQKRRSLLFDPEDFGSFLEAGFAEDG